MSVTERFHLFAEAMKVCWAPKDSGDLGDPKVVGIDIETEVSDNFTATLREKLQAGLKSPQPGEVVYHEPMNCTSHISTADAQGNMVSLTQTHGGGFGSMVTVPGDRIAVWPRCRSFRSETGTCQLSWPRQTSTPQHGTIPRDTGRSAFRYIRHSRWKGLSRITSLTSALTLWTYKPQCNRH